MIIWPLYTRDQTIFCNMCNADLGLAKSGECLEFGDGYGNFILRCDCGWSVCYDLTRSAEKAKAWASDNAEYFEECRMINIKAFAKQGRQFFIDLLSKKTPKAKKKSGAFSSFSTADLITEETRKVSRK